MSERERSVVLVAGARPNFMKVAPVLRVLRRRPRYRSLLVHTGQHYDDEMSHQFFSDLERDRISTYSLCE